MSVINRIATIQVLLDVEDDAGAADILSGLLEEAEGIRDWGYLKVGSQTLYSTEKLIDPDTYEEGDFLYN